MGTHQIKLDAFLAILRYLGTGFELSKKIIYNVVLDMDSDELSCILANLIAQVFSMRFN